MKSRMQKCVSTMLALSILLTNAGSVTFASEKNSPEVNSAIQKTVSEVNVALASSGAIATSTDNISQQEIYAPDKAIDGMQNSWWGAAPGGTKVIHITLAKAAMIERAAVIECTEWGTRVGGYKIEVAPSDDSTDFTLIGENKTGSPDMSVNITNKTLAKKVRVTFQGDVAGTRDGMNIAEIELYANVDDAVVENEEDATEGNQYYTFVDDRDPSIQYGAGVWTKTNTSSALKNTITECHTLDATVSYTFHGTGIRIIGEEGLYSSHNYGPASILIDGVDKGEIGFAHTAEELSALSQKVLFDIQNLEKGNHTLELKLKKSRVRWHAIGIGAKIDGFKVYDSTKDASYMKLKDALSDARVSLVNAKVGDVAGNYPQEAVDALKAKMDVIKKTLNENRTTEQMDAETANLETAIQAFAAQIIGGVTSHNINLVQPENGNIAIYNEDGTEITNGQLPHGQKCTLKMTPNEQYGVAMVQVGDYTKKLSVKKGNMSMTFTANQDVNLTASIKKVKIKIATIGDSITYGVISSDSFMYSYPADLQRILGEDYEVRNFGMPGAVLKYDGTLPFASLGVYAESLLFQPDEVIIMLGTNDGSPTEWAAGHSVEKYKRELTTFVNSYKNLDSNPTVYLATAPKNWSAVDQASIVNGPVKATLEIAPTLGSPIIDVQQKTFDIPREFHAPDGCHLSDIGYEMLAHTMLEGMKLDNVTLTYDKSLLYDLYDKFENVKESDCAPNIWATFSKARSLAKNLLDNSKAMQSDILIAKKRLLDASSTLTGKPLTVSKGALWQTMDDAVKLDLNKYTKVSADAVKYALAQANVVIENENLTSADQGIVDEATTQLKAAIAALVEKETEDTTLAKSILKSAIEKAVTAEASVEFKTLAASVKALITSTRSEAQEVFNNSEATNAQCMDAWMKLANALQFLDFQANKVALFSLIEECNKINLDEYTIGVEEFKAALADALSVHANDNVLQATIDAACIRLQAAKDGLKKTANKTLLEIMITGIEGHVGNGDTYNKESNTWADFVKALADAKAILANEAATQAEVDAAVSALSDAYTKIRLLPSEEQLAELNGFLNQVKGINRRNFTSAQLMVIDETTEKVKSMINDFDDKQFATTQKAMVAALNMIDDVTAQAPSKPGKPGTGGSANAAQPNTGDYTSAAVMAFLLFMSGFGVILLRRKRNQKV